MTSRLQTLRGATERSSKRLQALRGATLIILRISYEPRTSQPQARGHYAKRRPKVNFCNERLGFAYNSRTEPEKKIEERGASMTFGISNE